METARPSRMCLRLPVPLRNVSRAGSKLRSPSKLENLRCVEARQSAERGVVLRRWLLVLLFSIPSPGLPRLFSGGSGSRGSWTGVVILNLVNVADAHPWFGNVFVNDRRRHTSGPNTQSPVIFAFLRQTRKISPKSFRSARISEKGKPRTFSHLSYCERTHKKEWRSNLDGFIIPLHVPWSTLSPEVHQADGQKCYQQNKRCRQCNIQCRDKFSAESFSADTQSLTFDATCSQS